MQGRGKLFSVSDFIARTGAFQGQDGSAFYRYCSQIGCGSFLYDPSRVSGRAESADAFSEAYFFYFVESGEIICFGGGTYPAEIDL